MGSLAYPATKLGVGNGAMGSLTYPAPKLEVENGAMGKSLYGQRCGAKYIVSNVCGSELLAKSSYPGFPCNCSGDACKP